MTDHGDDGRPPGVPPLRTAPLPGRVLCFAPHPDDEVIGPGGALCLHRRQGDPVRVVVVSDGVAGDPDGRFADADYGALRRRESREGLAELGVEDLVFWGFPDACVLSDADLELGAQRAAMAIADYGPDVIYAPWEAEGNTDHRALSRIVARAAGRSGFGGALLGYEVWDAMLPDFLLDISPVAEVKRRALRCYRTQMAYVDYEHVIFGLNAFRSLVHNRGAGYCEAFRHIATEGWA